LLHRPRRGPLHTLQPLCESSFHTLFLPASFRVVMDIVPGFVFSCFPADGPLSFTAFLFAGKQSSCSFSGFSSPFSLSRLGVGKVAFGIFFGVQSLYEKEMNFALASSSLLVFSRVFSPSLTCFDRGRATCFFFLHTRWRVSISLKPVSRVGCQVDPLISSPSLFPPVSLVLLYISLTVPGACGPYGNFSFTFSS